MNWQTLYKRLKQEGYSGKDNDLEAVKSFIESEGLELEQDGKPLDVDSLHAKAYPNKKKLDLTADAAKARIEQLEDELKTKAEEDELLGKNKRVQETKGAEVEIKVGKERLADDPNFGYGEKGLHNYFADVVAAGGNASGPGRPIKGSKLESYCNALTTKASLSTYGNENTGADGGFSVPHTTDNRIQSRVTGEESLLSRTDTITVSGNGYTETRDETTPWGSTGIQCAWEGEAGTIAQSKPILNQRTWLCHKVAALVPLTNEVLQDSVAIESHVNSKAPEMIDFKIGEAIIRGTGAGMPLGILNSAGTLSIAKESNQPADTIKATNIQKMLMRMYPAYLSGGVFLAHPDTAVQLHELTVIAKTNAGTNIASAGFVFNPTAQEGAPFGTLYQRPIIYTQHCETVGDVGDLILADLSQYRSVVKGGGINAMQSPHFWFDQDVTALRFVFRMGGGPKFETTISPRDGSNTMAAFLTIAAR